MDRLAILARRTAPALAALVMGAAASSAALGQVAIHVSPGGSDNADGSAAAPVQSLARAQTLVRAANAGAVRRARIASLSMSDLPIILCIMTGCNARPAAGSTAARQGIS